MLRKIARIHGVTVGEVKRDMQIAIDAAYKKPTVQAKSVDCSGEKPTPDELINHAVKKVKEGRLGLWTKN
jgi:hypothetical protein